MYGAGAYILWGGFPLYFPLLEPAGTLEILAQRMAWSMVAMLVVLIITRRFRRVAAVVRDRRRFGLLASGAVLVGINWGTYIYGVNSGHVVETSLGYFINPLFTILLGVLALHERLNRTQWVAVGIGAVAVVVIAVDYGRPPWIALVLAASFGMYGFCKKLADVPAVESMAVETGVQFLPAVVTIAVIGGQGDLVFGTRTSTTILIATSGVITVVPLLMFAASTRLLPLSILGLLQYLAPVLQFSVGIGIRHESLPPAELAGFCLVWLALIILTINGLRSQRAARDLADAAASVAA